MASQSSRLADLAIVVPPSYSEPKQSKAYRRDLKNIMNIVYQTTNPGGVCCLILSGGMSESSDVAVIADAGALSLFEDQWALREEIIWVRDSNTRNSGERGIEMINLEETPFSHIFVLERFGAKMEFVPRSERPSLAGISRRKREEIEESVWHIPPKLSDVSCDRIPREVAVRIIMSYSNPGETVLAPFVKSGAVRDASKELGRAFRFLDCKSDHHELYSGNNLRS